MKPGEWTPCPTKLDCIKASVDGDGRIRVSDTAETGSFTVKGHEVWDFAVAIVNGTATPEIMAAIHADRAREAGQEPGDVSRTHDSWLAAGASL